jgi:DNA polymerase-3 subunit epsilon
MKDKRLISLDTETTGLYTKDGHRVIEIGCVEIINRRLTGNNFHQYLNPGRESDPDALRVHGITSEFLADKPRFEQVAGEFIQYIKGAELVIHNAPFDVGFLNNEFGLMAGRKFTVADLAEVTDSLTLARHMHPGQKVSLDALCRRYEVSNNHRVLHGALLDAEILADVFLAMTGGQVKLSLDADSDSGGSSEPGKTKHQLVSTEREGLVVVSANHDELHAHNEYLTLLRKKAGDDTQIPWDKLNPPNTTQ